MTTITLDEFEEILTAKKNLSNTIHSFSNVFDELEKLDPTLDRNTIAKIFNYSYMRVGSSLPFDHDFVVTLYENFITKSSKDVLDSYGQIINIGDIVITGYFVHHKVLDFTSVGTLKTLNLRTNRTNYKNRFGVYKLPNV